MFAEQSSQRVAELLLAAHKVNRATLCGLLATHRARAIAER
jgi:hypothetical protein